ncbi:MAG: hypothetical protein ACRDQA_05585, partial [Nocardioidaceae bacterium]
LATVDATYTADVAGRSESEQRFSWVRWQTLSVLTAGSRLTTPTERTEYVIGDHRIDWQQTMTTMSGFRGRAGLTLDSYRTYTGGEQTSATWNADPGHPSVQHDFGANPGDYLLCPACRRGNTFHLAVYPFGDNQPGHVSPADQVRPGQPIQEETHFAVYKGDQLIGEGPDGFGSIPVPPGSARYRLVYDTSRTAPWWTLSTTQHTAWGFDSSAADGTGTLPPGWYCDSDLHADCATVPLLFADYHPPTDNLGQISPGRVTMPFAVRHLQHSSTSPISTTLEVSFDGGATWQQAAVQRLGGGRFRAQFTVPPADQTDGFGAVRLSATDADGSTLHQTVLRSFAVSAGQDAA